MQGVDPWSRLVKGELVDCLASSANFAFCVMELLVRKQVSRGHGSSLRCLTLMLDQGARANESFKWNSWTLSVKKCSSETQPDSEIQTAIVLQ